LGENTVDEFATLHQTEKSPEKTVEPEIRKSNSNSEKISEKSEKISENRGSEDQSFRSSRYSVDQSISLSAISGEFENKSVSLSRMGIIHIFLRELFNEPFFNPKLFM